MRKNVIAVLMIASAFSSVVRADLSSTDQNIVDNYILKNPSIPSDKIQAIRGMDNLQSIEDYLKGNTYWNGTKNVGLPLLDFSDDKPVAPQNPSETQQQGNSTQVPQNQQEIDELNLHKQEQIEQAAERQRQADIQQALLDAHNQEQINTTVDNKLQTTQALDNKQTQDIDHNAATIADNTKYIGQVEHDADTRAQNQEQINTAVDNKLQATQA
ncbi:hypothetical protein, partial [Enterobacter sp. CC120223-11]|uniref:hypothetical protein n=1 Tax=Enterobacter sp. CC120223-11 TaxID=1378073 RepID=UPI000BD04CC4